MTNFGASFKKARESKGITLDQIAKETRISTRFLAAIEDEEFELLPGGIFNRGFVRTFAERVGLEPDQAVADYERLVSVRVEPDPMASENARPSKNERRLYPIALGVLAIAIAIFYVVTRDSSRAVDSPVASPELVRPVQQDPPPSPPVPEAAPETTQAESARPPTTAAQPEPVRTPPPPVAQAITLDIQALEPTWIKVRSDGNSVVAGEILERGMTRKFTAEMSLYISVGNAAGLTLKINDRPVKPLGKSGQIRSVTFTPANLKDFIG